MNPARLAPALVQGVAVVDGPDRLLIEGGPSRRLFTGRAATEVLPRVLPLLDGRHDQTALAERLGLTPAQLTQVITALDRSGLLEYGADPEPPGDAHRTYLSRSLGLTRRYRNAREVSEALAACAVAVVGRGADELAEDLRTTGVGSVHQGADAVGALPPAAHRLVVAVGEDDFDALAERCRTTSAPLLRIAGDRDHLEVGPYFSGTDTACASCFRAGRRAKGWPSGRLAPEALTLACGLAATEAVALLTGLTRPRTGRRMIRFDLTDLQSDEFDVTPEPGCRTCGVRAVNGGDEPGVAALLSEWLASRPSAEQSAGSKKRERPTLPNDLRPSPRVPLTEAGHLLPAGLADVLAAADARPAADTYVLGAAGLPHPVHRLEPGSSALFATRSDLMAQDIVLAGLPPSPLAVLVFVATPAWLSWRWGAEAYRQAHIEAGFALTRVRQAAGDRFRCVPASGADPRLPELLELYPRQESVAGVVGIYGRGTGATADQAR